MKKLFLLFALIFAILFVGCSSDNSLVSPNVNSSIHQAPGIPTEGDPLDGNEGDPDSMGDGLGKLIPTVGDTLDGNEGDPDSMGDGLG